MKRVLLILLMMMLLFTAAQAEIVNLVDDPDAALPFDADAELMELVFPCIYGSDCCIIRYQGKVLMIDASTDDQSVKVIRTLKAMGIESVDIAFNSHPHDDHITGFEYVGAEIPVGKLIYACDENYNYEIRHALRILGGLGVPAERLYDTDTVDLWDDVTLTVIQRFDCSPYGNDRSALLKLVFGDCSILFCGDIENRAHAALCDQPPACGLKADIIKYPHHGYAPLKKELLAMMSPELAIVTSHPYAGHEGFDFLKRNNVPALSTWYSAIRLRTDGQSWVVDRVDW